MQALFALWYRDEINSRYNENYLRYGPSHQELITWTGLAATTLNNPTTTVNAFIGCGIEELGKRDRYENLKGPLRYAIETLHAHATAQSPVEEVFLPLETDSWTTDDGR